MSIVHSVPGAGCAPGRGQADTRGRAGNRLSAGGWQPHRALLSDHPGRRLEPLPPPPMTCEPAVSVRALTSGDLCDSALQRHMSSSRACCLQAQKCFCSPISPWLLAAWPRPRDVPDPATAVTAGEVSKDADGDAADSPWHLFRVGDVGSRGERWQCKPSWCVCQGELRGGTFLPSQSWHKGRLGEEARSHGRRWARDPALTLKEELKACHLAGALPAAGTGLAVVEVGTEDGSRGGRGTSQ